MRLCSVIPTIKEGLRSGNIGTIALVNNQYVVGLIATMVLLPFNKILRFQPVKAQQAGVGGNTTSANIIEAFGSN